MSELTPEERHNEFEPCRRIIEKNMHCGWCDWRTGSFKFAAEEAKKDFEIMFRHINTQSARISELEGAIRKVLTARGTLQCNFTRETLRTAPGESK
jgi:hypothetical protein